MVGIQIAIDGPAAAGKSTIAKIAAEKLGYTYIDTGAMYRALTHKALKLGIHINDGKKLEELLRETTIELAPGVKGQVVLLDGVDVSEEIRTLEVTNSVSAVSAHSGVRKLMVEKQQVLGSKSSVVMDGRDIGTDVLPGAELKIFMTASVEERAERRHIENSKRGIESSLEQLKSEISERDRLDTERVTSPLRQAEDAILIDTTSMSIDEVAEMISQLAKERLSNS
ncbi:(d)CMP kinase [Sporosarcina sp. 6E9]|uniref:(d)CMP kinase n=1 Tax=Sporosarcina sp. 6E9 TaxID=2819235 RepID=UPI001ACE287A|nr:(d)CMP kinase [Sporosarcina sp. 6E9]MBO1910314.1 (d)CMP kinase [Microvirga sp. 3-52]